MEGPATWPQLVWILGLVIAAMTAGFLGAWRIQTVRSRDSRDLNTLFDVKVESLESRVAIIEKFNAAAEVVLEHMEEFRKEVKDQYDNLRRERHSDMEALHRRLDALHNAARLERIFGEDLLKKDPPLG